MEMFLSISLGSGEARSPMHKLFYTTDTAVGAELKYIYIYRFTNDRQRNVFTLSAVCLSGIRNFSFLSSMTITKVMHIHDVPGESHREKLQGISLLQFRNGSCDRLPFVRHSL